MKEYLVTAAAARSAGGNILLNTHHHGGLVEKARYLHKLIVKSNDHVSSVIKCGESVAFEIIFGEKQRSSFFDLTIEICDVSGTMIGILHTSIHPSLGDRGTDTSGATCLLDSPPLIPGEYLINLRYGDGDSWLEEYLDVARLNIIEADVFGTGRLPEARTGPLLFSGNWSFAGK